VNTRQMPKVGHSGSAHHASITIIPSAQETSNLHIVGVHWVSRFLNRHPAFKQAYTEHQERNRKSAEDPAVREHFYTMLANLIRRLGVKEENIWNCDEKGIIMGRNGQREMAIVRASKKDRTTSVSEGSREYCSVLETISAAGKVIPPFIIWQGKSHRESYYRAGFS
jgi:hypothetical protein